jgi:ubiquinone/menaquinone biosynthesis C-methylase UbiE
VLPFLYDLFLAPLEQLGLRHWRASLAAAAAGRVVEIGAGTGRNLPYYRKASLVLLTDPDLAMLGRARARAVSIRIPSSFAVADAQALPFPMAVFDSAVVTLAFCTIPNPETALQEIRRVLVPGGMLYLLEHVRTPRAPVARLQDLLTPCWRRLAGGCHLNRRSLETAIDQGFTPVDVRYGLDGWLVAATLRAPLASP